MDLRQLEYFLACVEHKNFSMAAEHLYTSQPHVSTVINALEQELGYKLFERTPRGVVLTEAGKRNYEYAANIVKNARLLEGGSDKDKGLFTLYTNSSSNMAMLFTRFFKQHREHHYKYFEAGVETILEKIALHEAELGFVFVPSNKMNAFHYILSRKKLEYVSLVQSDLVVYVGSQNPIYGKQSLKPEDLKQLKFIQMIDDYFSFQELLGEEYQKMKDGLKPDNVIETSSSHVMVQMLNDTDLCNLCSYWLKDRYKYYDFRMIPVEGFENKISFGYIKNMHEELSSLAEEFLEYIKAAINEEQK